MPKEMMKRTFKCVFIFMGVWGYVTAVDERGLKGEVNPSLNES